MGITLNELKFLAEILNNQVTVRVAEKSFAHSGINYSPGALFISPRDNEHLGTKLHEIINNATTNHSPDISSINSGSSSKGIDLGSSNFNVITKPKIGVLLERAYQVITLAKSGIFSSNKFNILYPLLTHLIYVQYHLIS